MQMELTLCNGKGSVLSQVISGKYREDDASMKRDMGIVWALKIY